MKNILLFGAGKSATVLIDYLLSNAEKEDWQLTVVDADINLAQSKIGISPFGKAVSFDIRDETDRKEFIKQAAEDMKAFNNYATLPAWMMQLAGIFNRPIKESIEMVYQSQFPYIFNSAKFNKAFKFEPTSYHDGIRETAIWTLEQ